MAFARHLQGICKMATVTTPQNPRSTLLQTLF